MRNQLFSKKKKPTHLSMKLEHAIGTIRKDMKSTSLSKCIY